CGQCIPGCPEGALQVIDGKARLISDLFCDGLGACIKECPAGAIRIEEREAEPYDERRVMENIVPQGAATIRAHLLHLKTHGEKALLKTAVAVLDEKNITVPDLEEKNHHAFCPGSQMRDMRSAPAKNESTVSPGLSRLQQWPVQLKLVNPSAPYFDSEELLVAADCTAFAHGNFHERFMKDTPLVIFCPKLDQDIEGYVDKLAQIFEAHPIRTVSVVRMVVPCCGGSTWAVEEAVKRSGKSIIVREIIISIEGKIQ
ncbi:MAG: ATP-binding protein, partial [Spirochaetota bacterium]